MKNSYIFQNNTAIILCFLQISLTSGLVEDSCNLMSISAFNLLLCLKYKRENLVSSRNVAGEGIF
jgi:hypothetical protein